MVISRAMVDQIVAHAQIRFSERGVWVDCHHRRSSSVGSIPSTTSTRVRFITTWTRNNSCEAITEIDDHEWELGGIYHSHTRTRAYPSATDVRLAFYPDALYLIVSLADDSNPELRGFRIQGERSRKFRSSVS